MKHICVDARNITSQPAGIGRYALELMTRFPTLYPDVRWTAIRHSSNREEILGFESVFVDQEIGNAIDYAIGGRAIRRAFSRLGKPDLFHSFFHIVPRGINVPFVTTLHDTIWIDHADVSQATKFGAMTIRAFASRAIPDTLRRAKHVIAISAATAQRAEAWIPANKMTEISHGVSENFFHELPLETITQNLKRDDHRYLVAIGNDKPYKNFRRVIEAFDRLNSPKTRLALIGSCDELKPLAKGKANGANVWFLGKLSDVDLRTVLQHADGFIFPSLVEGFGLPILEAMASGVPTVVSDLEPMRSVAGEASLLVDPLDIGAMVAALRDVLDPKMAANLKRLGNERARKLTWEKTARETFSVYDLAMKAGS